MARGNFACLDSTVCGFETHERPESCIVWQRHYVMADEATSTTGLPLIEGDGDAASDIMDVFGTLLLTEDSDIRDPSRSGVGSTAHVYNSTTMSCDSLLMDQEALHRDLFNQRNPTVGRVGYNPGSIVENTMIVAGDVVIDTSVLSSADIDTTYRTQSDDIAFPLRLVNAHIVPGHVPFRQIVSRDLDGNPVAFQMYPDTKGNIAVESFIRMDRNGATTFERGLRMAFPTKDDAARATPYKLRIISDDVSRRQGAPTAATVRAQIRVMAARQRLAHMDVISDCRSNMMNAAQRFNKKPYISTRQRSDGSTEQVCSVSFDRAAAVYTASGTYVIPTPEGAQRSDLMRAALFANFGRPVRDDDVVPVTNVTVGQSIITNSLGIPVASTSGMVHDDLTYNGDKHRITEVVYSPSWFVQ